MTKEGENVERVGDRKEKVSGKNMRGEQGIGENRENRE